ARLNEIGEQRFSTRTNADHLFDIFQYYKNELADWTGMKASLVDSAVQAENLYQTSDMLGDPGLLIDNRNVNPSDMVYMSQAEQELENLKTDRKYWSNELFIAEAVKDYAEST